MLRSHESPRRQLRKWWRKAGGVATKCASTAVKTLRIRRGRGVKRHPPKKSWSYGFCMTWSERENQASPRHTYREIKNCRIRFKVGMPREEDRPEERLPKQATRTVTPRSRYEHLAGPCRGALGKIGKDASLRARAEISGSGEDRRMYRARNEPQAYRLRQSRSGKIR